MYSVGLATLGCKVSQYETEAVAEAFEARGFRIVDFSEHADVYVINTCTVTAESDRKSRQMVRRAYRQNPNAVIMVMGCYAQTSPEEIAAIDGVSYISGTNGKMLLPDAACKLLSDKLEKAVLPVYAVTSLDGASFESMSVRHAPRTRAYVKIEDGCECRCTYCAIPGARGCVRSKKPEDVLREIEVLAAGGTREVVLTGIETASYGVDLSDCRLIDLLEMLDEKSSITRIRLGSLTPEIMRSDFIGRLAKLKKLVPHFHLSMQSGSDSVLRGMKRRYNTEMALFALQGLRAAIPHMQFTTDMMVGFPGETDAAFEETMAFSQKAAFLDMHVFAYSRRPGTPAASYEDQVPESVKKERSAKLIALAARMRQENLEKIVRENDSVSVLFETEENGIWHGHSDEFAPVCVASDRELHGRICRVRPQKVQNGYIVGSLLDE